MFTQTNITTNFIDSEINKIDFLMRKGEFDKAILKSYQILNNSKKINYSKGATNAYLNLSNTYMFNGNFKKSLFYLGFAEKEKYAQNNPYVKIRLMRQYSNNYMNVGLYDKSIKELNAILILSNQVKSHDSVKAKNISMAYSDIGWNYKNKKRYDSATIYLRKSINIVIKQREVTPLLQGIYLWDHILLSDVKIQQKKIDSAFFYITTVENSPKDFIGNQIYYFYKMKGLINFHKSNFNDAINDYNIAIGFAKKVKSVEELVNLYDLISQSYNKNNDIVNAIKYKDLYFRTSDSLEKEKKPIIENTVDLLLNNRRLRNDESQIGPYYSLVGVLFLVTIVIYFYKESKNKPQKTVIPSLKNELLIGNDRTNFDEIIQLVKTNDSSFLFHFLDIYPNFQDKLLEIEPTLQNSEIRFCALIFLQFSTKEIATYTYVLPRSIQTRKNRLRKKLNIPSDEDIYVWIRTLNLN